MNISRRPFEHTSLHEAEQRAHANKLFGQLQELAMLAQDLSRNGQYIQDVYRSASEDATGSQEQSVNILGAEAVSTLKRWRELHVQVIDLLARELLSSRATRQNLQQDGWLRDWLERYAEGITPQDSLLIQHEVAYVEQTLSHMSHSR